MSINDTVLSLLERFPDKKVEVDRTARLSVEPKLDKYLTFTEEERSTLKQFADKKLSKIAWVTEKPIPDKTYYHAGGAPRYIFRAVRPEAYVEVTVTLEEPENGEPVTKSFAILDVSKLNPFIIQNLEQPRTDEIIKINESEHT